MKRNVSACKALLTAFGLVFALASCGGAGSAESGPVLPSSPAETYEYWKGSIPNSFYSLNIYGDRALKVTGKPWMVLKRDRITLQIIDCEFGLSEVTQTQIPNPNNQPGSPEPTVLAAAIDFHTNLQLDPTKPVVVCVGWGGKSGMVNGFQTFAFKQGSSPGGVGNNESWSFSFLSSTLWGDVTNIDKTYYLGSDSDSKAFSLLKL